MGRCSCIAFVDKSVEKIGLSVVHGCPPSVIGPTLLLLSVLGTVCPNMSRPHPLCLFSEVFSRPSSSGVPSHDFHRNICSDCSVTVVIFGHLNPLCYRTFKPFHKISLAYYTVLIDFQVPKCTKFNFFRGSIPDPAAGADSAPPDPLACGRTLAAPSAK